MLRLMCLILLALPLAGCGADGEPVKPVANTSISIGTDGISTSTSVGVVKGQVSIGINL